jgi:uncharacterized protein YhdP
MKSSHFKSNLKFAAKWFVGLSLGALILTLLLTVATFWVLVVAEHNGTLDRWIKSATGWQVTYQKVHVSIHAWNPSIVLNQVVITDPQDPKARFVLQQFEVDFAVWSSLFARAPMTSELMAAGLQLNVQELPKGQWRINNIVVGGGAHDPAVVQQVLYWLIAQKKINISNLHLDLSLLNGRHYIFQPVNVLWYGRAREFKFDVHMMNLPQSKLNFSARFIPGTPIDNFAAWQLRFNGNINVDDFSPLFAQKDFHGLRLLSGGGSFNFNGLIAQGGLNEIHIGLNLNDLNLLHANARPLSITELNEQIFWKNLGEQHGWSLYVQPIKGAASALGVPGNGGLVLTYHPQDLAHTWVFSANDIDLSVLNQWIIFLFTPEQEVAKVWNFLNLQGDIHHLQIMSGTQGGSVTFSGHNLILGANEMFSQGWPASDLSFETTWQKIKASTWQFNFSTFNLSNAYAQLKAHGSIKVPLDAPLNSVVNLTANLEGKNLAEVRNYYIPQDRAKGLARWLGQGLVALPNVSAQLLWRGQIKDMPYADAAHPGVFNVTAKIQNGVVQPWFNWPLLTNVNAQLLFHNQRFTLDADDVNTQNIVLHHVHLEYKDMRPSMLAPLVITGAAQPTGMQALNYLAHMPLLSSSVQNILANQLTLQGTVPLTLTITLPLHQADHAPPVVATGTAVFNGNDLYRVREGKDLLLLKGATGTVAFENQYVSSSNVSFTFKDIVAQGQVLKSPVDNVHFLFPNLSLYGQSFTQVDMFLQPPPSDTKGPINNPLITFVVNNPNIAGQIILQPSGSVVANLDKWIVNAPPANSGAAPSTSANASSTSAVSAVPQNYLKHLGKFFANFPPFTIVAKDFWYDGKDLGSLLFDAVPMSDGIDIHHLTLGSTAAHLDVAGSIVTHGTQDEFSVAGALLGNNFGAALTQLGYPGILDSGNGEIQFQLNWFGTLLAPDWQSLQGSVNLALNSGKFLKVDTGFAQIFGLLSLNTVVNTFSLNFKNIFEGGLGFNSINGNYIIRDGIARTNNLVISGPTIDARIKGDMDFVNQTLDQVIVVQPQVATSVAIAATVLGGPIIGAATFAANELLGNTVLRNSGFVYRISGPWSKPSAVPVTR